MARPARFPRACHVPNSFWGELLSFTAGIGLEMLTTCQVVSPSPLPVIFKAIHHYLWKQYQFDIRVIVQIRDTVGSEKPHHHEA